MTKSSDGSFTRVSVADSISVLENIKKKGITNFTSRDIKELYSSYSQQKINGIIRKLSDRNKIRFKEKITVKGINTIRRLNKYEVVKNGNHKSR